MSKFVFNPAKCLLAVSLYLFGLGLSVNPAYAAPRPVDRTPPSTPVVIDDGKITSSTTTLHARWSANDPESGISEYKYAIGTSKGGSNIKRWTSVGSRTEDTAINLKLKDRKTYYFSVKAKNGAGRWSRIGFSDGLTVIIDTFPPIGSIRINLDDQYTNSTAVTLELKANDIPVGGSGLDGMRFSNDGSLWQAWQPYAETSAWRLLDGNGIRSVYVQFSDKAGNVSVPRFDSIILDTTLPVANAGADQSAEVNQALVFDGSGSSDNNGIANYAWDFGDGSTPGSGVQVSHSYSQSADYSLTLSVTDIAGNAASDTAQVRVGSANNHPPVLEPIGDKTFFIPKSNGSGNVNSVFVPELNSSGIERVSDDGARPRKSTFVPDEILIKIRPQTAAAQLTGAEKVTTQETTQALIAQLTPLIEVQGYQIKSMERVFKDLENVPAKTTAKMSAAKYAPRAQRTKLDLKDIPDLENIYKIKLTRIARDKKTKEMSSQVKAILFGDELLGLCRDLEQSSYIVYAQPNFIRKANLIPNDPLYGPEQWGLGNIQAEAAWDIQTGSPNVIVGVIDTGFDYTHPDLSSKLWINPGEDLNHNGQVDPGDFNGLDDDANGKIDDLRGWDFNTVVFDASGEEISRKPEDNDPSDIYGHGSLVSGVIAAAANNNLGIAGVSWSSRILAAKGLGDQGYGLTSDLAKAIKYAADNGADVINMSFGGSGNSPVEDDALSYAYNLGSLLVAAAGNDNIDASFQQPANNPQVIAVAATDPNDKKASFSNWGNKIELAAPGVDILSTASRFSPDSLESKLIVISDNQRLLQSDAMRFSATTPPAGLSANLSWANLGRPQDFTGDFTGKIVLMQRGGGLFLRDMVRNAAAKGAIAALIYNNVPGIFFGTLQSASAIPAISLSLEDGQYLKTLLTQGPVEVNLSVLFSDYIRVSGTSFSAPYVSGVAALILSRHPEFDNESLRLALRHSADDLLNPISDGQDYPGFDIYSGYGRLNAYQAMQIDSVVIAKISSPVFASAPSGTIDIIGTAKGVNFQSYTLEYAEIDFSNGRLLSDWNQIVTSAAPVTNGTLARWDSSGIGLGSFRLRLRVRDSNNREFVDQVFLRKPVPNLPGWPVAVRTNSVVSSPAVGDLDGDGDLEVVVGSVDGKVYAWHHTGELVPGWPVTINRELFSSPAIADIDADGDMEIVIGSAGGGVYAFHHNGTLVSGWPVVPGGYVVSSPAIADIDRDGKLEIIISSYANNKLFAFHHDGTLVSGWPVSLVTSQLSSPTVGDIDGDGDLEIVIGSENLRGSIYAFHHNGALVSGWPINLGITEIQSSPALGDLDADGDMEIVISTFNQKLYALDHNGSVLSGWPVSLPTSLISSPTLGDIDGDGDLEIFIGDSQGKVHGFQHNGALVSGWPVQTAGWIESSVALGDIDGNGDLEIVVGSEDGNVYAWQHNGLLAAGWPVELGENGTRSSAAIADLDGDGDMEIILGAQDSKVYAIDQSGPGFAPYSIEWGKFRHDLKNSGLYPLKELAFSILATDVDGDALTYSAVSLPPGASFNSPSRSFKWRPSPSDIGIYPNVRFAVSDGQGGLDSEDITITVR